MSGMHKACMPGVSRSDEVTRTWQLAMEYVCMHERTMQCVWVQGERYACSPGEDRSDEVTTSKGSRWSRGYNLYWFTGV